jgi:hypothetical protein
LNSYSYLSYFCKPTIGFLSVFLPPLLMQRAHFKVTAKTTHGEGLLCSHPVCRSSGIKFRYCTVCLDAIARRSFKHHMHQDVLGAAAKAEDRAVDEAVGTGPALKDPPASDQKSKPGDNTSRDVALSPNRSGEAHEAVGSEGGSDQSGLSSQSESAYGHKNLSVRRRKKWLKLLKKRPKSDNNEAMEQWLENVKAVSDLEAPLNSASSESFAGSGSSMTPPSSKDSSSGETRSSSSKESAS